MSQRPDSSEFSTTAGPGSKIGILPERFDGTTDFRQWLRHFDACGDANSWTAADHLRKLPAFLRGRGSSHILRNNVYVYKTRSSHVT